MESRPERRATLFLRRTHHGQPVESMEREQFIRADRFTGASSSRNVNAAHDRVRPAFWRVRLEWAIRRRVGFRSEQARRRTTLGTEHPRRSESRAGCAKHAILACGVRAEN